MDKFTEERGSIRALPKIAILAALALAACAPAEITPPPISITPKNAANAVGLDVYAGPRSRGNPVPSFHGQETLPVRATGVASNGQRKEISGVHGTLDAGVYSAQFTTPANLIVPDYGPNSAAIFIRCAYAEQSRSTTIKAFNATSQRRMNNAAAGGILGVIIIGAVTATNVDNDKDKDKDKDEFKYPAVMIQMREQKN